MPSGLTLKVSGVLLGLSLLRRRKVLRGLDLLASALRVQPLMRCGGQFPAPLFFVPNAGLRLIQTLEAEAF